MEEAASRSRAGPEKPEFCAQETMRTPNSFISPNVLSLCNDLEALIDL